MGQFRFFSAGESHGPGLTAHVEGLPAGLEISEKTVRKDLARRQKGYGRGKRQQIETDYAKITSGVRHGISMGGPISMFIENRDFSTGKGPDGVLWTDEMSIEPTDVEFERITNLRPGHADTPGIVKYQQDDARNILERSSARESAARVAAGSLARLFIGSFGIQVHSHVTRIGKAISSVDHNDIDWDKLEESSLRCADPEIDLEMIKQIDLARESGDSLGGVFEIVAYGVPIGLGSHTQWDKKLSSKLAAAIMSINAVKGVEFGAGFEQASMRGSEVHDVIKPISEWETNTDGSWVKPWPRKTNNSGGLEGGMSTGEPLVVRAMVKPIATIMNALETVDLETGEKVPKAHYERSDITFVSTCAVIGESMLNMVIADAILEKFGGDHIKETKANMDNYLSHAGPRDS
jgi:chorismate synthase